MNAHTPKDQINAVANVKPQLPAISKPGRRWKLLDKLASTADELVERFVELGDARKEIWQLEALIHKREDVSLDEVPAPDSAELTKYELRQIAECKEMLALLTPPDCCDEDGDLKASYIAQRLTIMASAITAKEQVDPKGYAMTMIEHVASINGLTYIALDDACRERAEGKNPFHPHAGDLVALLRERQNLWDDRTHVINQLEIEACNAQALFTRLRPRFEAAAAERIVKDAERVVSRANDTRARAIKEAIEAQTRAAEAAKQVEAAFARLADADANVDAAAQALAQAVQAPGAQASPAVGN